MLALFAPHALLHWQSLWLVVAAFLAGMLNAVAGGGSFLQFPALMGTGMLPVQANATNTIALLPGQLAAAAAYREDVRRNLRLAVPMGLAGFLGGTAGSITLLRTPQSTFLKLVPWLFLIAATIFALSRPVTRWLDQRKSAEHGRGWQRRPPRRTIVFLLTVVICFYIGYFGAGAGFLIMTMLALFGFENLHEINALKVVSTSCANGMAFLIFTVRGYVEWRYCLIAMVACAIGGFTSASLARRIPQPLLRGFVIAIGFGMSAWYFWKTH